MTGAEALNLIMGRLNRTQAEVRANVLLEMKLYQQMTLEKGDVLPDFLIEHDTTVALTAGNRRFTLPENFLRELDEDETVWILDDDGEYQPMTKCGFDDSEFMRSDTGDLPLKYAIQGLYGYTFPEPTEDRTIKMDFYATGATIADDGVETVWLKHAADLIVGGTGVIIATLYVQNTDAAIFFAAMEKRAKDRLLIEQTARAEAGRSRRMG